MNCEECGSEAAVFCICDECRSEELRELGAAGVSMADLRRERDDQCDANAVLREANKNLLAEMRAANERAEKAERERDEARSQAVFARPVFLFGWHTGKWHALSPIGALGANGSWLGRADCAEFDTAKEAIAAGRAVPWWTANA